MWVNQSINRAVGISVFGSALLRCEPDLAHLRLGVIRVADKPNAAFRATQDASLSVREAIRRAGIADNFVQVSRTALDMAYGEFPDRKFLGYRAGVELRVLVEALDQLQSLLSDVVEAGAHEISEVRFTNRKLKDLRARARSEAVSSARQKAEAYADAAGTQVGQVVHIEDVNPDQLTQRGHAPDIDASDHDDSSDPGILDSGSLIVTAAVMVVYSIVPRA